MNQVNRSAYGFRPYSDKGRWVSYYHQLDEITALEPRSLLEIGVGDKVLAGYLKNNTDISHTSVDIAEDLQPDKVASVESLPFATAAFDVVCAFEVLEHLPFEKFRACLAEISRVSARSAIISLPHFGPALKLLFKAPFLPEVKAAFKLPWPRRHAFQGQHYWEIGKRGYPASLIRRLIGESFLIKKEFVPFENQYHRFFVLEKRPR